MLSISQPIKGGSPENYYLNLASQKYYTASFEEPGKWSGTAAERLGLRGKVDGATLRKLFAGYSPDGGEALVQNAGGPRRTKGWDLTFSAPKSVSVLWALASEEVRDQIERAHAQAVEAALGEMERHAGVARRGPAGSVQEPARMLFATFQHSSSRSEDPLLHTHALAINLTFRSDGTSGSLHSRPLFRQKMTLGDLYRTKLAAGLVQRLGLKMEEDKVGFHVVGVPRDLCERLSQRRSQIRSYLAQRGESGAIAAKAAALATRSPKTHTTRQELLAEWQAVGKSFGWGRTQADQLVQVRPEHVTARDRTADARPVNERGMRGQIAGKGKSSFTPTRSPVPASRNANWQPHRTDVRFAAEIDQAIGFNPSPAQGVSEFRRQVLALAVASRTPRRIERIREGIIRQYGTDPKKLQQVLKAVRRPGRLLDPRVVWESLAGDPRSAKAEPSLISVERRRLFPDAPTERLRSLALPALAVRMPRVALFKARLGPHRWWRIHRKWNLGFGEARIQNRELFTRAPAGNPLYRFTIPAFRLTARKSKLQPNTREARPRKGASQKLQMTMGW